MAFGGHLVVHRYANRDTRSKHLYFLNLRGILPIKLNITDTNTYWVRYSIKDFKHQNFMITDIPYHTRPLIIPQILCRFQKEEGALPLLLKVIYFIKFVSMNKLVMFTLNSVLSSPEYARTDCLTRRKIIYEKSTDPTISQPGAHELKLFFKLLSNKDLIILIIQRWCSFSCTTTEVVSPCTVSPSSIVAVSS